MKPLIIAIDGPAASGKSTIGSLLADRLGYLFFDTGILYRAVTQVALERHVPLDDPAAVTQLAQKIQIDLMPSTVDDGRQCTVLADGADITWQIREPEVDANVSVVSAYAGVRAAMSALQRQIGLRGRVVMVGRDIGTVVLPEANLKVYLDASPEERAWRRFREREERGQPTDLAEVQRDMLKRDRIDSSREVAPLKQAPDAVYVDSTGCDIPTVLARMEDLLQAGDAPDSGNGHGQNHN